MIDKIQIDVVKSFHILFSSRNCLILKRHVSGNISKKQEKKSDTGSAAYASCASPGSHTYFKPYFPGESNTLLLLHLKSSGFRGL